MQFPYWIEVMCKRYFPKEFAQDHTALGPHFKYSVISKLNAGTLFWAGAKARRHARTAIAKKTRKRRGLRLLSLAAEGAWKDQTGTADGINPALPRIKNIGFRV